MEGPRTPLKAGQQLLHKHSLRRANPPTSKHEADLAFCQAYFWSGFKRMNEKQLHNCLDRLALTEDPQQNPHWESEAADEKALSSLLKGTCRRFLNQLAEAKAMLTDHVLSHDLANLKACDHGDTWPLPVAHYELAVCLWQEAGGQDGDRTILKRCSDELAKIEKSESFDLEARVGLKVTTARETLRRCGIEPT